MVFRLIAAVTSGSLACYAVKLNRPSGTSPRSAASPKCHFVFYLFLPTWLFTMVLYTLLARAYGAAQQYPKEQAGFANGLSRTIFVPGGPHGKMSVSNLSAM